MLVEVIKTAKITTDSGSILEILDAYLPKLKEGSVVAITSKIVAICEGSVAPLGSNKQALVAAQSQRYLPAEMSKYRISLAVKNHIMIPHAGIDESNSNGMYTLWPQHPAESAIEIRAHLMKRDGLTRLGVVITDSTTAPLRTGTSGISVASAGFEPVNSYIGRPDLFGRPLEYSQSSVAHGLAVAAVLLMGEGVEQTPLVVIQDVPFVTFTDTPSTEPAISIEDDLYAPLLTAVEWHEGGAK